jgi:hypothetical protein
VRLGKQTCLAKDVCVVFKKRQKSLHKTTGKTWIRQ